MSVVRVAAGQVLPGMIVAEDVYSAMGDRILAHNTIISSKSLSRLRLYDIKELTVYIPKAIADKMIAEDQSHLHMNKLRESVEFKQFRKNYLETIDTLKDSFSTLATPGGRIDIDPMMKSFDTLLTETKQSQRTFDMLHCIRDYDDQTYVHSLNVALICSSFRPWLEYNDTKMEQLMTACLLHDIGKLRIPSEIISKPTALDDEEFALVKTHAALGYEMVKNLPLDQLVKDAVLMHHERYDGSGYPHGLKGTQATEFARIIAIADVYDAMTSLRVYRDGICPFDVLETFERDGYQKFDVSYLIPFLERIANSCINAPVRLSNALVGEVVMINKQKLSRPVIKVDNQFFDLSKIPELRVRSLL